MITMLGLAFFCVSFLFHYSRGSVCTNTYGGHCRSGGCPSGYGYTYSGCYYSNDLCCIPPSPQTTPAPTTTTTRAPVVGIHSCSAIYGGTCHSQSQGCPSNHGYTFSHCGQGELCCIPYAKQTTHPTTHVTSLVNSGSTSCSRTLHGYCIKLLSSSSCPSSYTYTYSYCGFLELCCIPPHTSHTTHAPVHGVSHGPTNRPAVTSSCGTSLVGFTSNKIVGGTTSQHGEFPWQISLRYYNQHICGGTLIDGQWVVTAAHCFEDSSMSTRAWSVGVGLHDMNHVYSSNVAHVSYLAVHEHYNGRSNVNDIAILKLSKRLDTSGRYIRPACLPKSSDNFEGDVCTVSGWGDTRFYENGGPGSRYLKSVNIGVLRMSVCKYYLGRAVHSSTNICAGDTSRGGKDSCQGDSGGPLICKKNGVWELAGIVSWGYGCGDKTSPGVYTKVSSYLNWIHNKMSSH